MKWLNMIGLTLQFLAFWFAAPELLGQQTLKRFENGLIKLVAKVPAYLIAFLAIGIGFGMSIYGIKTGLSAAESNGKDVLKTMGVILVMSVLVMAYFIFFAKHTQRWLLHKFAKPLIHRLINNQESRKLALVTAAFIFTIGFLCQLFSVLLS